MMQVATITVDAQGRLTEDSTLTIDGVTTLIPAHSGGGWLAPRRIADALAARGYRPATDYYSDLDGPRDGVLTIYIEMNRWLTALSAARRELLTAIGAGCVYGSCSPGLSIDAEGTPVYGEPVWRYWRTDVDRRSIVTARVEKLLAQGTARRIEDGETCRVALVDGDALIGGPVGDPA